MREWLLGGLRFALLPLQFCAGTLIAAYNACNGRWTDHGSMAAKSLAWVPANCRGRERNMASSTEAFRKLGSWKKSKTVLRVTILTKGGMPNILTGMVLATDAEAMQVGFAALPSRDIGALDLSGAVFSVGKHSLEARRSPEDILLFEET